MLCVCNCQEGGRTKAMTVLLAITRAFPAQIFLVKGRPRLINFDNPEWLALLILGDRNLDSLHFERVSFLPPGSF